MNTKVVKSAVVSACTLMVLAGIAAPSFAGHADGQAHDQATGMGDYIVVNLGFIGDVLGIICFLGTVNYGPDIELYVAVDPDGTGTSAPTTVTNTDTPVPTAGPVTSGTYAPLGNPSRVCLGGIVEDIPTLSDGTGGTVLSGDWVVIARDYVWNGCADTRLNSLASSACGTAGANGVDDVLPTASVPIVSPNTNQWGLGVAALARIQLEFTETLASGGSTWTPAVGTLPCGGNTGATPSESPLPAVCRQRENDQVFWFRNTHNFGFCGAGDINLVDSETRPSSRPMVPPAVITSVISDTTRQIQIFQDSPAFYATDCAASPGTSTDPANVGTSCGSLGDDVFMNGDNANTIAGCWRTITEDVNFVTCRRSDDIPDTVCFFTKIPSSRDPCMSLLTIAAEHREAAVIGLVGEVKSTLGAAVTECNSAAGSHDDWGDSFSQGSPTFIHDGTTVDGVEAGLPAATVCFDGPTGTDGTCPAP